MTVGGAAIENMKVCRSLKIMQRLRMHPWYQAFNPPPPVPWCMTLLTVENEPQQLTAAELARWVIQLCKLCACSTKHCMFSLAHLNSLMCCKSLVSC